MNGETETAQRQMDNRGQGLNLWRLLPLLVIAAGGALFFALDGHQYLTFDTLRDNHQALKQWVGAHQVLAVAAFIGIYALGIVFVPPSGTVLTLAGGFVFGVTFGTVYVVIGATLGATILFEAARHAFGHLLRDRAGRGVQKMRAGFQENAFSYMLFLRLVPVFPFWLVNLAPAFLGVRLRTYVAGTFLGIIPGTAVYALVGDGLGSIFERNEDFTLSGVITPEIVAGLVALGLLSLAPTVYKKVRGTRPPRM